jgi:hypothetical protein
MVTFVVVVALAITLTIGWLAVRSRHTRKQG